MLKSVEMLTRRMCDLGISCEQGNNWDLAITIEEDKIGYDRTLMVQFGRDLDQLKNIKSLKYS